MTRTFTITIYDSSRRFVLLREECYGETPRVDDLVTAHPAGDPSGDSLTACVSGVQRVLKPVIYAPGTPRTDAYQTAHVAVTAFVRGA